MSNSSKATFYKNVLLGAVLAGNATTVSYTHLTLPTIYSV